MLCLLAGLVYWPALHGGFILDDDVFLTQNPLIHSADGLRRFWFTPQAADYWPVTSTSLWIEWRLWGLDPFGYHVGNLALHLAAALLLWRILFCLEIPGAWLAALLFAIHPINVESVAWITQRKNTLAMVFFLAAILAFVRAELSRPAASTEPGQRGQPGQPGRARRSGIWLGLSLATFTLALLSKGSVIPLPFVLLGLVAWRRSPTARDAWRLLPFFALAALFAIVNVWFQHHDSVAAVRDVSLAQRLLGACAVPWFYLGQILAPVSLAFLYPQWHVDPAALQWWLAPVAALGVAAACARYWTRGGRIVAFAAGYFWVMLLPVLGLADIRFMRFSLVADHYAHLAMIGVVVLVSVVVIRGGPRTGVLAATIRVGTIAVIGALATLTWQQCRLYRDARTLYVAALARNPVSPLLHNNLGCALQDAGQPAAALAEFQEAVRLQPDYAEAQNNLGSLLSALGRTREAVEHCEEAVRLNPRFADAADNLGVLRAQAGRTTEAVALFEQALADKPGFAMAHYNLAGALAALGRQPDALAHLEETVRLQPDFAKARNSLGGLLFALGRVPEALAQVSAAIQLQPGLADAHTNLGVILQSQGRAAEAREQFEIAARLRRSAPATPAAPGP